MQILIKQKLQSIKISNDYSINRLKIAALIIQEGRKRSMSVHRESQSAAVGIVFPSSASLRHLRHPMVVVVVVAARRRAPATRLVSSPRATLPSRCCCCCCWSTDAGQRSLTPATRPAATNCLVRHHRPAPHAGKRSDESRRPARSPNVRRV